MKEQHYHPEYKKSAFHCPSCGVYANQQWENVGIWDNGYSPVKDVFFSYCTHCKEKSIWLAGQMIHPKTGSVELPHVDLPDDAKSDYIEAREILNISPRGSAALLRLAIQKLCVKIGGKGKNINQDIAELVKNGLPVRIQQSLDYVRVIGNNAVHPGQIDLKDNMEIAVNLFRLLNLITDVMITQPKEVEALYNSLPENNKEAINKRDKNT
ncbi:MAG: DUF4145 domain-containing protein [Crocinitomicaceae bacterium]|nr:DUF4145 domain-containing protein [Crocinitomicaceae bacterium]